MLLPKQTLFSLGSVSDKLVLFKCSTHKSYFLLKVRSLIDLFFKKSLINLQILFIDFC